jgi:hypothetical protein
MSSNATYQELTAMPAPVDLGLDVRAVEFCVFLNFFRFFCVSSSRI